MSDNERPRRVDFLSNKDDYECAYMGALGFSTKAINNHTKLRAGQITYRLKKAHIKRMDYRDGVSSFATIVYRNLRPTLSKQLNVFLKCQ